MARGSLTENERNCFDANTKNNSDNTSSDVKPHGLRVRFIDEEGKTERLVSTDEVDCAVARVQKIHILKNRSSSETSILLRNPSLGKRRLSADRVEVSSDSLNNNSSNENLNGKGTFKNCESVINKTENSVDQTKDGSAHYKKHSNVYSVNQAKTLTAERKKTIPILMKFHGKGHEVVKGKSSLPSEVCLAEAAFGKELTARTLGRISRGLGRLLRRTNSVRISEPDPVYKVVYLGNVLTGWARGESCVEKPLATLWRNYQQSTKPDVVMKLSVTNSGLKGFTKEHGLTEYWSHRITYCASPPHYPKLFCWVYRHEGKKLKHELRCHAVLCTKDNVSKKITEELQVKLKQALVEFKKDRISKQNARLSLANSVYDNPSMPRRKIMLSVGALNYRPPLERSKSAPKLGAIEELCSEEDEEEAEMKAIQECNRIWRGSNEEFTSHTLDRRRLVTNARKLSCPEGIMNIRSETLTDEVLNLLVDESNKINEYETSHSEGEYHRLEAIDETSESNDTSACGIKNILHNYLVTDSDDGSVSSGCDTASTATSDTEPTSLPLIHQEDTKLQSIEDDKQTLSNSLEEVNHVPIGEKNAYNRESTFSNIDDDSTILNEFENKFESLTDNLTDLDDTDAYKNVGDNESACSDESGYSELLDNGKDSVIGNTIMV